MKKLILALAFTLSTTAAFAGNHPPKGFDQKVAKEHLLKHQKFPASKEEILASCNNLMDFSAEDKKWVGDTLPDGSYKSAADVMKALGIK